MIALYLNYCTELFYNDIKLDKTKLLSSTFTVLTVPCEKSEIVLSLLQEQEKLLCFHHNVDFL